MSEDLIELMKLSWLMCLKWATPVKTLTMQESTSPEVRSASEATIVSKVTLVNLKKLRRQSMKMGGFTQETLVLFFLMEQSRLSTDLRTSSSYLKESTLSLTN